MRWAGYLLILLVLIGAWLLDPSLAVLGGIVAMIVIPLLSWGLLWLGKKRLRLELTAPATAQKGERVQISMRLDRKTKLPMGPLELTVCVANSITEQTQRQRLRYSAHETMEVKSDYCGCLYVRIEKARLYDLFSLLWVDLPTPKEKRVVIMPDTFPVLIRQDAYPAPMDDCEDYAPDRKGQDRTETYQVRGYVPGDSLAQIHWKLSSKLDQLMVRDPGCPIDQNLMVFVDRSWGSISPAQADAIMEAAVSICQSLSESGVTFQLVWNEETIHTQKVTEQDQLPEAVSSLLKSKAPGSGDSGIDVYLGLHGPARIPRVIHIGAGLPEQLEEFSGQSHLVSLLCSDGEDGSGVICFGPGNYQEALAQVSWS